MEPWQPGGMPEMVFEYILKQKGLDPAADLSIDQSIDFGSTAAAFSGGSFMSFTKIICCSPLFQRTRRVLSRKRTRAPRPLQIESAAVTVNIHYLPGYIKVFNFF